MMLWERFPKGAPLIDVYNNNILWRWEGFPIKDSTSILASTKVRCIATNSENGMLNNMYTFDIKHIDNLKVAPPGEIKKFLYTVLEG
jgi:hypothetical protein